MQPAKRAKKATEHAKTIWLITYGATSPHISPYMFSQCGLSAKELYCIQWRESKYTLVQLHNRVRRGRLQAALEEMHQTHKVILSEILGYDSISSNAADADGLEHHPGFKRMVELLNQKCPSLISWIDGDDTSVYTNKRGLLWSFIEADPEHTTTAQMKRTLSKWAPLVREYKDLKSAHDSLLTRLSHCEAKLDMAEGEAQLLHADLQTQESINDDLARRLVEKQKQCIDLMERLIKANEQLAAHV